LNIDFTPKDYILLTTAQTAGHPIFIHFVT